MRENSGRLPIYNIIKSIRKYIPRDIVVPVAWEDCTGYVDEFPHTTKLIALTEEQDLLEVLM